MCPPLHRLKRHLIGRILSREPCPTPPAHGFPFVSHMSMGLRLVRAAGSPLLFFNYTSIPFDFLLILWLRNDACIDIFSIKRCHGTFLIKSNSPGKWSEVGNEKFTSSCAITPGSPFTGATQSLFPSCTCVFCHLKYIPWPQARSATMSSVYFTSVNFSLKTNRNVESWCVENHWVIRQEKLDTWREN